LVYPLHFFHLTFERVLLDSFFGLEVLDLLLVLLLPFLLLRHKLLQLFNLLHQPPSLLRLRLLRLLGVKAFQIVHLLLLFLEHLLAPRLLGLQLLLVLKNGLFDMLFLQYERPLQLLGLLLSISRRAEDAAILRRQLLPENFQLLRISAGLGF
jgi:hypothetical protein